MSTHRTGTRLGLALAACSLLAACAVAPPKPPPKPATVIARPEPPRTTVTPLPRTAAEADPWESLTASFVMNDCNDSPLVRAKLHRYTRSPTSFERMLKRALPMMLYVQERLQATGVPGEFVMLPMLESSYDPHEPSRHGDPAGMWQLMPATARRRGLTIDRAYDGRLDPVASTAVAIDMLKSFDERYGDWRLADFAYNAGPHAVARALRRHPQLGDSAIPDIPMNATTRKHLAKLMALSCIVRDPQRFHVQLPRPSPADRLTVAQVPAGLHLRAAARMADLSERKLRALNPGYLGSRVPRHSPGKLLLPATAAESLAAALAVDASQSVAEVDTPEQEAGPNNDLPLPREPAAPQDGSAPARPAHTEHHHVVRKGETLWSIAHHYDVTIAELKRWNHLDGDEIQPGEKLQVGG